MVDASLIALAKVDTQNRQLLDAVSLLLGHVGEDPARDGLKETPRRYVGMLRERTRGYSVDASSLLKTFPDESYSNMVTVGPIPFYSLCEHHLVPFFGNAWISYLPNGRLVGLSKLPRVLDAFSRRLQVQERLTDQVATTVYEGLQAKGVACVIKARHLCMEMRGVETAGAFTTTTALYGAYLDNLTTRQEFLQTCDQGNY